MTEDNDTYADLTSDVVELNPASLKIVSGIDSTTGEVLYALALEGGDCHSTPVVIRFPSPQNMFDVAVMMAYAAVRAGANYDLGEDQ